MTDLARLRSHLIDLVQRGQAGERLPTVRLLMRQFGLSQAKVQNVLAELREQRVIVSDVGRGTFLAASGAAVSEGVPPPPSGPEERPRSVLILRRPGGTRRSRLVLDALQQRLADAGHQTLDVGYSDARHASLVLRSLPRFDGCVIQSSFDAMPIEMLAAVQRKADAIAIDGAWLVGTDLDAVGFEWGEPVERAVALLRRSGHRRICLATAAMRFLANDLGLRRYAHLQERSADGADMLPPVLVQEPPYGNYAAALVEALRARVDAGGGLSFTGLVVWGIESGAAFRTALEAIGIDVPGQLSVVLLGRTDIAEEADGFFNVIGYRASDQCDGLHNVLLDRWKHPQGPTALRLLSVHQAEGRSVRMMPT